MTTPHPSKTLATFASQLKIGDIPNDVLSRAEDLLVDWFGSAIAGKGSRPVESITQFAQSMGGFSNTNPGSAILLFLLIVAFVGLLVWVTLLIRKTAKEGNGKLQVLFTADGPAYQAVGWELTGDLNVLKVSQKSTALAPLN